MTVVRWGGAIASAVLLLACSTDETPQGWDPSETDTDVAPTDREELDYYRRLEE